MTQRHSNEALHNRLKEEAKAKFKKRTERKYSGNFIAFSPDYIDYIPEEAKENPIKINI